jgi:DNA-binding protein Alba
MGEVYIGRKPIMNYVLAVITQFNSGEKEVSIKARGKSISRAVDVAEILRNKLLQGVQIKEIKIGTEEIPGQEGNTLNVSTIEIVLEKP